MAIRLKEGDKRGRYGRFSLLNSGYFALSYSAHTTAGQRVFFKQFSSPSMRVEWYEAFKQHRRAVSSKIQGNPAAKASCYRFVDLFEHRETKFGQELRELCEVFEFIDAAKTLTHALEARSGTEWRRLTIFAQVLALGIQNLNGAGIVHTDLKPDNVILIPDTTIGTGYRLRLIDFDWAIIADRPAPWHGKQGYVGTPGYRSPEHVRQQVPERASDVFTTGIMLSQILAGRHPFDHALTDEASYAKAVTTGKGTPIVLDQPLSGVRDSSFVQRILNAMLDPVAARRPSMEQVSRALSGHIFDWPHAFEPTPTHRAAPKGDGPRRAITLSFEGTVFATANVDGEFGKHHFAKLHPDARYCGSPQFRLLRRDGGWMIEHSATAPNDTIVDGKKLVGQLPVTEGMTICVGNSARGITKLPIVLRLVEPAKVNGTS